MAFYREKAALKVFNWKISGVFPVKKGSSKEKVAAFNWDDGGVTGV